MNFRILLLVFVVVLVADVLSYKVPSDPATQLKLKKRGQGCMARILPRTPQSKALQKELSTCFKVDCALALIPKVERQFPREFRTLKGCMGY